MGAVTGTGVGVPTEDGTADAYLTHPPDGAPRPAVLWYMDAFGPRPRLRETADRLAGAGYTVLVPKCSTGAAPPRWPSCPRSSTTRRGGGCCGASCR